MSIRNINKDHLKEHAGVELVTPELLALPDHEDPLKFWTHHETENTLVDLTVFAEGDLKKPRASGRWAGPFTGRPQLILQLAPAIKEAWFGCTSGTIGQHIKSFRAWWRLFDAVEQAAVHAGQAMDRVEDVRQLTRVHLSFAHRIGMRRGPFHNFYRIANVTLVLLGATALYWKAPVEANPIRHLPPEDQTKALRIALKQEWYVVRKRWQLMDRIRGDGFEPQTDEESNLMKHWRHFAKMRGLSGEALPTPDELRGGIYASLFIQNTGLSVTEMRKIAFPDRWEADTAFHLCLANTGWNPAVLFSLDSSQQFLRTHPRNPNRYLLIGTKARAGGTEQPVSGLWKTTAGPGFIIRLWMERTAPLREQLTTTLAIERIRYAEMARGGASVVALTRQIKNVQQLETGCRSVWLFVNRNGDIDWLGSHSQQSFTLNDKKVPYLALFLDRLNRERVARDEAPIPLVTKSDFRDIFALYIWRTTGGNILALMRALNHSRLRTTQGYTDTNILNAERDHQAGTFLDHLLTEWGAGRVDITILSHLQRYGAVGIEMEQRLADFRTQQRSRMGVACKDPFHPPTDIQTESTEKRMCGPQRCLLCKPHAVILPESMSGIAMRVEELEAMQAVLPVGIWLESRCPEEMHNGMDVLRLFPSDDVRKAREHWAQAIASGLHHIPGIHLIDMEREIA